MPDASEPMVDENTVPRPEGASLEEWLTTRIARYATRTLDWDALKFQADFDPKYRRSQMRYVGTGGTGVDSDDNAVPAEQCARKLRAPRPNQPVKPNDLPLPHTDGAVANG